MRTKIALMFECKREKSRCWMGRVSSWLALLKCHFTGQ